MRRFFIPFFLVVATYFICPAQNETIDDEFRSPLGIPLILSGTFAELRGNHFHGGIDIKTNGKQGYKVYSTQEGFISRIKVQGGGYGHALYIEHPNGYTTVYGHLKQFNETITSYIRQQQYAQESFSVDLYLTPNQFKVSKGEVIGLSGNTGSSGGPHLHYEIRKTQGQIPINPLKYTKIKDDIKPSIQSIKVHELSSSFYHSKNKKYDVTYVSAGKYKIVDTIKVNQPVIGLSIKAIDKLNGANNSNGFVSLKNYVDGNLNYAYSKDEMPFDKGRYINAHIDYPEKKLGGGTFINCFKLPGNNLHIYDQLANDGRIWLSQYPVRNVVIEVCDFAGNESKIELVVKYEGESTTAIPTGKLMPNNQYNLFGEEDVRVEIPNGALYDDLYFTYEKTAAKIPNYPAYSDLHQLHNETAPLHKFMTVEVKAIGFPAELRSKALMANLDRKGRIDVNSGNWIGDYFQAKTRNFGQFFITTDTQNPKITAYKPPTSFNYSARSHMMFKISDNLAGIKSYKATVDGNWVLMQHDPKRSLLFHEFDGRITAGKHNFKLVVTDYVGNQEELSIEFTR